MVFICVRFWTVTDLPPLKESRPRDSADS